MDRHFQINFTVFLMSCIEVEYRYGKESSDKFMYCRCWAES
jgi:hypothetical protein